MPHRVAPLLEPMNRCGYSSRQNLRKLQLKGSKQEPELKRWMDEWMDGGMSAAKGQSRRKPGLLP